MELTTLIDMNTRESQPHWGKEALDDSYALDLLHRALGQHSDEAWSQLEHYFSQFIRKWLHCHPSRDVALLRDSEENYIAQTFSRFWYAVHTQELEFTTVYAALRYLRATLNGLLIDTLRCHLRGRAREVPIPMEGSSLEVLAQDSMDEQSIWQSIESLLHDERERRLAYLLYYCGLKPRDIVARCSQEFDNVKEIYRLNHNIIERLRRNRDRLRLLLALEV
jgi:hypothetical protein